MSLDAIGIASKDILKSAEFYKLLGVSLEEIGEGHYEGTTANGTRIMLDSFDIMKKINPKWKEPLHSGVVLCFKQDSSKAVDELYLKITKAGFTAIKEPWDAFWGQRYSSVQDPNGNQVDLFADLTN